MSWSAARGVLRRLLSNDALGAMTTERAAIHDAIARAPLPPSLARYAAPEGEGRDGMVEVGAFVEHPGLGLLLPVRTPPVHSLLLGGTGTGKTRAMLGIIRAKLAAFAREGDADRVLALDPKGELVGLVREVAASLLPVLSDEAAERLLSRLVVVDPFGSDALLPFNVLTVEDGTDTEAAAWDLVGVLGQLAGSPLGVLQDAFTHALVTLGMELAARPEGFTLLDLAGYLDRPHELRALGLRSANPAVRAYFSAPRLPPASLHGVRARLTRLLRLPGARRMLGARTCTSFRALLRDHIVLLDLGSSPLGSRDVADFWLGVFGGRLARAVFARDGSEPASIIVLDEFHMCAEAARWTAADLERILAVSRSRRVHLMLASQSLDAARRASSALPHVALTNCDWRMIFRVEIDDARAAAHLLPVTGRRPRGAPRPWDETPRDPFLSPAEEMRALVERLARLPQRELLFADRTLGGAASAFVRTSDVVVARPRLSPEVARRVEYGALALPPETALRAAAPATTVTAAAVPNQAARLPRRRGRVGG